MTDSAAVRVSLCESEWHDKYSIEGRVHSLKNDEEGEDSMCEIMENLMEKRSRNDRIASAKELIALGKNSLEEIAKVLHLPLSTVQELASSMTDSKAKQA